MTLFDPPGNSPRPLESLLRPAHRSLPPGCVPPCGHAEYLARARRIRAAKPEWGDERVRAEAAREMLLLSEPIG